MESGFFREVMTLLLVLQHTFMGLMPSSTERMVLERDILYSNMVSASSINSSIEGLLLE